MWHRPRGGGRPRGAGGGGAPVKRVGLGQEGAALTERERIRRRGGAPPRPTAPPGGGGGATAKRGPTVTCGCADVGGSRRGSSGKLGTIQRRLPWPLRNDDTHESRSVNNCLRWPARGQDRSTFGPRFLWNIRGQQGPDRNPWCVGCMNQGS